MLKSAAEDDEIVAGNQTMSLKCPVGIQKSGYILGSYFSRLVELRAYQDPVQVR